MPNVTVSAAAQSGATLADKLTAAYALAPVAPDRLIIVIDAGIPKHSGEVLPTPPSNCDLLDYRTVWDAPSTERKGTLTLDFGNIPGVESNVARGTVLASWVKSTSVIVCQIGPVTTADHDADDPIIESLQARAIDLVPGVSFDIGAYAPNGTWGRYVIIYEGLV